MNNKKFKINKINLERKEANKMRRFHLPKKVTIPAILLVIVIAVFGILYGANSFFNKYKLEFQSPIQSPILVQERDTKIISPVASTEAQKKNHKTSKQIRIVPIAEAQEVTKTAFVASSPIEEKIAHYVKEEYGEDHVEAMISIFQKESGVDPCKINGGAVDCNYQGERACGLGQAMPCSKLKNVCPDLADVDCQMKFWVNYTSSRYDTPEQAWAFWQRQIPVKGWGWW